MSKPNQEYVKDKQPPSKKSTHMVAMSKLVIRRKKKKNTELSRGSQPHTY